jgi:feruloyl esterase
MHSFSQPNVTLVSASVVSADERYPAYCKVTGTITIDIGFEVRLPDDWNGRFYMVGNEGSGGAISDRNLKRGLILNYAVAATDQGHNGAVEGRSYGYNNRQKEIDYGFRAVHLTADVAKGIIGAFYDKPAAYSYFVAGSAGGRQALMEAQRFPDDFDGILLSAPVHNISLVHLWGLWKARALSGDGYIHPSKMEPLAKVIYGRCDELDRVNDGVINDPRDCDFDPAKHLKQCGGSALAPDCFTSGQVNALKLIYGGVRNSKDEVLFPGQPLGAEAKGDRPPWMRARGRQSAWEGWLVYEEDERPRYLNYAEAFLRYSAFPIDDPEYDVNVFDFDADPARMSGAADIMDADDPDLTALRDSGGKMIHHHGWSDTAVPASNSVAYFEKVQEVTGNTDDFYRFFLIPGGFHGGAQGTGAGNFAWMDAIVKWVENGEAPDELIGRRVKSGETVFTRKICPYPKKGVYKGRGDTNSADNFECVN